jgi:hypothetical protein
MSTKKQQQKSQEVNISAILDYAHPDLTWAKDGYAIVAINKTNHLGKPVGPSGYKAVLKQNKSQAPFWRATVPMGYAFVPEEPIESIIAGLQERILETFPDIKKKQQDFKIERVKKHYSHGEDTQYWEVHTNLIVKIKNSYAGDNDQVKLGFAIRNGYNTDRSLGIDVFTYRLVCSNGAISKGSDLAKNSIRHVGKDPQALVKAFHEALIMAVEEWFNVIDDYNKMATTQLTPKIAQYIYEQNPKMPRKFFPEYYAIPTDEEIKKRQESKKPVPLVTLTNEGKNVTLWENFNDMTYKLWRAQDPSLRDDKEEQRKKPIAFDRVAWRESQLHKAMRTVLNNPERFV